MDTKKLRQKILDLAIHGKLVPQDPNDEPASVLLERIRAEKEALIKEGKIKRAKKVTASDTSHYENVPFEVPDGWCWCKVTEALTKLTDGTHHSPFSTPEGDFKYITAKNIKPWGIDLEDITYVDKVTHDEIYARCNPEIGDILYIKDGATTGVVCINDLNEPFSLLSSVALLKPSKQISNRFLLAYLQSSICYDSVRESMKGVGITRITLKIIENWDIPLPPYNEQVKIADSVEFWLHEIDKIETNCCNIKQYVCSLKSKILDFAIHGKLVPQNPNDEPASELLKRINPKAVSSCDNPHYENIPSTWVCTTIGSIFQHNTGKALNKSTSEEGTLLPYLTTSNVYWNSFDLSVIKEMRFKDSEMDKCTVQKGDLLVCEGGDIGRSAIWNNDYSICIQNHLHRLRPKGGVIPLLYMYYIMHLKRTNNIEGKGIGLQGLSSGMLDKLEIPLPPYNEQKRIVDKIQETFYVLDSITESLN